MPEPDGPQPRSFLRRTLAVLFPPDESRGTLPPYRPSGCRDEWNKKRDRIFWVSVLLIIVLAAFFSLIGMDLEAVALNRPTSEHLAVYFFLGVVLFFIVVIIRWITRIYHDLKHLGLLKKLPDPPPPPPPKQHDSPYEEYLRMEAEVQDAKNNWEDATFPTDKNRPFHIWLPGLPGQGKSTLMKAMAIQDFCSAMSWYDADTNTVQTMDGPKKGVTIIDPHGDLAEGLLPFVPMARVHETVYFDLKHPVPIDFLGWSTPEEKQVVVASMIGLFETFSKRVDAHVGKVMESILYPLLRTLLDAEGVSFLDIYHFLEDSGRKEEIIEQATIDPYYRNYWRRTRLNPQETQPITRLLIPIVHNPVLRKVFGCPHTRSANPPHAILRLSDVLLERKIFIANLAHNIPNDPTPEIIAALIISKLQQAAFSQPGPESNRVPHYVYADEFQKYQVTSDFSTLLAEARKFKLCLTMANQRFDQIDEHILRGVQTARNWYIFKLHPNDAQSLSNAGMMIREKELFNKAKEPDADMLSRALAKELHPWQMMNIRTADKPFPVSELVQLKEFHAIRRSDDTFVKRVKTTHWSEYRESPASNAEHIMNRTMDLYACKDAGEPLRSSQDDAIKPTGPPKKPVPPDKNKGSGPRNPR